MYKEIVCHRCKHLILRELGGETLHRETYFTINEWGDRIKSSTTLCETCWKTACVYLGLEI